MKGNKLIYLATPYTDSHRGVEIYRFQQVTAVSAVLLENGVFNFSPITQSHEQHMLGNLPGTWDFWKEVDLTFLDRCDEIYVLSAPGWQESIGVTAEIKFAKENNIPVKYILFDENDNNISEITEEQAREVKQWTNYQKRVISSTVTNHRYQNYQG